MDDSVEANESNAVVADADESPKKKARKRKRKKNKVPGHRE